MGSLPIKTALITLFCFCTTVHATPRTSLVDLYPEHWAYSCLEEIIEEKQLLQGYKDHTFRGDWPAQKITLVASLAQLLKQLEKEHGIQLKTSSHAGRYPVSLSEQHWAYPALSLLQSKHNLLLNLEKPYSDPLTRRELAYALSELLQAIESTQKARFTKHTQPREVILDLHPDDPFLEFIESALFDYGLLLPYEKQRFAPEKPITRYELSASYCKLLSLLETESS